MPNLLPIFDQLAPMVVVLSRVGGLFILAPMLSGVTIPVQARALLAVSLSVAMLGLASPALRAMPEPSLASLLPLVLSETLVGFVIGAFGMMPVMAISMGGQIMGYQMGISIAQTYSPELDTQSEVVAQIYSLAGMGTFVVLGGVDALLLGVARSYESIPVGSMGAGQVPLAAFLDLIGAGLELAMRISAPVLAAVLVVLASMGAVMKTVPQFNVMSVGFTLKILIGVAIMISAHDAIHAAGIEGMTRAIDDMILWLRGVAHG
ncbi:MAG: flagellar biosynthetic protein FliR [Phycisphaerales bacterium]|jgi:flagellar biosynthetic protein FliR|nr:flagellar biosynthetic protein FliR [Phycisphaerales bacterium]